MGGGGGGGGYWGFNGYSGPKGNGKCKFLKVTTFIRFLARI